MNEKMEFASQSYTAGQLNAMIKKLKEHGEDGPERFLRGELAVAAKNHDAFRVRVNHDLSVKEAVSAGKYDWENDDINDKNFPSKRSGLAQIDIRLVHFNKDMSSEDVLKELDKMGLRPAELPELLALGAEYPDEQRKYPIVALGSVWRGWGGSRVVPCLVRGGGERYTGLSWFDDV